MATGGASLSTFTRSILTREGVIDGLWARGLGTNMSACTITLGSRLGLYPTLRDLLAPASASQPSLRVGTIDRPNRTHDPTEMRFDSETQIATVERGQAPTETRTGSSMWVSGLAGGAFGEGPAHLSNTRKNKKRAAKYIRGLPLFRCAKRRPLSQATRWRRRSSTRRV